MNSYSYLSSTLIILLLTANTSFSYIKKAVDAGPDVTYVVGSGTIDLNFRASTTSGTWTVTGGKLNGSDWSIDYSTFLEPFKEFTATLTLGAESDTKVIRAYNKVDPDLLANARLNPYIICENLKLYLSYLPAFNNEYFDNFYKEFFYQIEGSSTWVQSDSVFSAEVLGIGTHTIRERYYNIVNSFIYTDVETQLTFKAQPELFWSPPIPQLCTSDAPIDLRDYLSSNVGVSYSSNAGAAFSGTTFNPSVSGTGQFIVYAERSINGCLKRISYVVRVLNPCD
jgi:hypothetical protein